MFSEGSMNLNNSDIIFTIRVGSKVLEVIPHFKSVEKGVKIVMDSYKVYDKGELIITKDLLNVAKKDSFEEIKSYLIDEFKEV